MTCGAHRLLFDYYREKPRKPCPTRILWLFFKMAKICATSTKPLRRRAFRLDGLITPTVDIAPVKLYPYVKSKTQTHAFEFASCFCPYRLYPHDTLCTYGAKQLKLLGFSR